MEKRSSAFIADDRDRTTLCMSGNDHVPEPTSVTYTDYDDPFSFVHNSSGVPHIAKLSAKAWVGCGGDVYILDCLGKGYIRIEPIKGDEGRSSTSHHLLFMSNG